jgi:hypothetical protein
MDPVYHIPLTDDQLKQLGETAAIISLIERIMQNTVSYLLAVSGEVAAHILGSTNTRTYSTVWLAIVEAKCKDEAIVRVKSNTVHDPIGIPAMRELGARLSHTLEDISQAAREQSHATPLP